MARWTGACECTSSLNLGHPVKFTGWFFNIVQGDGEEFNLFGGEIIRPAVAHRRYFIGQ